MVLSVAKEEAIVTTLMMYELSTAVQRDTRRHGQASVLTDRDAEANGGAAGLWRKCGLCKQTCLFPGSASSKP